MRIRITLFVGLIAAMALGLSSIGTAGSGFKVTGGGQTDVSSDGGAGDTIAFTAQGEGEDVKGQVQYVDRTGGTGQGGRVEHGTVDCLVAADGGEQGAAYFAGTWNSGGTFEIYVEDNGEPNQGSDVIYIDENDPADCSDDDDEEDNPTALGRGNVQVHSADEGGEEEEPEL